MAEYSRLAKGKFTSTGSAQAINLPFQPDTVKFWNYTVANSAATSQNIASGYWDNNMGQGFAIVQGYNATPTLIYDTVTTFGISTFAAGLMLQYGAQQNITSVTSSTSPTIIVSASAHGLKSGDVVIFQNLYQTTTTGMQQIAGIPFTVTVTNSTTFTIPWNTSGANYTTYTYAAQLPRATFKQVLYPYLYFPGVSFISSITASNGTTIPTGTVQIDTTHAHNLVIGQEVAFRIPTIWGSQELNSLPNVIIPGSPLYGYVVAVTDYNTVIVQIAAASSFTAFNPNQAFASFPGEFWPQMVAVGDVNTGGVQLSSGSALYPPPYAVPIGTTKVNTINGPAIQGAYVNNTSQGFIIGAGAGTVLTTGVLVGASTNVIYWEATLHDISFP